MERDGLTEQEAEDLIDECRDELHRRLDEGEMPEDICQEWFGLEPDYLFDLIQGITMQKIKANSENCIYFYHEGWRYGKIIKRYSKSIVTVQDCSDKKFRVKLNEKGKWIAISNKNFKSEKNLREKQNETIQTNKTRLNNT